MSKTCKVDVVDAVEGNIHLLVEHFGLQAFVIGLHNASCWGKLFMHHDNDLLDDDDKNLGDWVETIDKLIEISKRSC